MKPFFVVLLLAFVTWTFVQFSNSFPTSVETKKSPVNTNYGGVSRKRQRKAYEKKNYLWPNGEIPYEFLSDFVMEEWCQIESAMYHIMWNSCIRFRRERYQIRRRVIEFAKYTRCVSSIGFNPEIGDGFVVLAPGCFNMQMIVHQIVHSIGFWDEATPRFSRKELIKLALSNGLQIENLPIKNYRNDEAFYGGNISCKFEFFEGGNFSCKHEFFHEGNISYKYDVFNRPYIPSKSDFFKENIKFNIGLESRIEDQIRTELEFTFAQLFRSKTPKLQFSPNKAGLFKLDVKALNKLYKCANPLKPSYDFIREFVEHHHRCVGVIYNDTISNNTPVKNQVTLKSNKKRSTFSHEAIVQGDILINVNQPPAFLDGNVQSSALNPATSVPYFNITTWTNGIIPYDLDLSLESHKCIIENAMLQIMLNTCIRFRPRNGSDTFYVRIFQDHRYSSCYGYIGMDLQNHVTKVSLPDGCLNIGTVVHELMHAIGFYHHQNRQDRDQHLKIHDVNIMPNESRNFRLNDPLVEQIFTPWDYDSVMLYGSKFFSKDNRSLTMEPTVPGVVLKNVYDKPGLSRFDAIAINQLYKCPNVSNSNFYSDLSLLKPMLKLVESCNSSSPENVKSYLYIFK